MEYAGFSESTLKESVIHVNMYDDCCGLPREFSGPRMIQSAELDKRPCCRNATGLLGAAGDLGL
jgi:hypothetical protein